MSLQLKQAALLLGLWGLTEAPHLTAALFDDVGLTQLESELGVNTPDGSSASLSQVEALDGANYAPDPAHVEFGHVTFTFKTGTPTAYSNHATNIVGKFIYGSISSLAQSQATVDAWEAGDWITNSLKYNNSSAAPAVETRDLQNHSWIQTFGESIDTQILRRFDYMLNRDQVLAMVGVNNDASVAGGGTDANLLSSSYHAVRVGCTDGGHMYGLTTIDTLGRQRIDIVAPSSTTSRSTAIISSAAALLVDAIKENGSYANAIDPRVLKAILLSGATKEPSMAWTNSSTAPLNARYGAGEVNVAHNHHILTAGQQAASDSVDTTRQGWDFNNTSSSTPRRYFFEVNDACDIAISLAWHRVITPGSGPNWNNLTPTLANLSLRLYEASAFTVGTLVSESTSPIDAQEHIWKTSLAPGRYVIEVTSSSSTSTPYGLAWRTDLDGAIALSFADSLPDHIRTGLLPSFTVEAVTVAGQPDPAYQGTITLSSTGTAAITGTLNAQAVNGVATFSSVTVSNHGTLILNAAATGLTPAVRSTIQVARIVDVLVPQFIQGEQDGSSLNHRRLPTAARLKLEGLKPSATYRYANGLADDESVTPDGIGEGHMLIAQTSGVPFVRCTDTPSFLTAQLNLRHGTFTTDAQGVHEGWFFFEPSDADIFTPANKVRARILINDGQGGESQALALTSASDIEVLEEGTGTGQGRPLIGEALSAVRNLVLLYTETAGSTRPVAITPVEITGAVTDTTYAPYYHEAVAQTARLWATLVPNPTAPGIQRIEERSLDTGAIVDARTDAEGFVLGASAPDPAPIGGFTHYTRWAAAHFPSAAELADTNISGSNADPTASGITNVQRYIGGLGDTDPPTSAALRIDQDNTSALIGIPFNPNLTDIRTRLFGGTTLPTLGTVLFDSDTAIDPTPDENGILWIEFPREGNPRYFFRPQFDLVP